MRYWEDFSPGQEFDLGTHRITREEIVDFAAQWDPQSFHLDEAEASQSPFGGVIASGWHTACLVMRRYVDQVLVDAASEGSPGLAELRWRAPVRPDDVLRMRMHVLEVLESSTRSDRGTVVFHWEVRNQDDVVALTMVGRGLFGRRPAADGAAR